MYNLFASRSGRFTRLLGRKRGSYFTKSPIPSKRKEGESLIPSRIPFEERGDGGFNFMFPKEGG